MKDDRRNLSDEELGELLRLGDPAGDGQNPSREDIAAMRRTVLNAVDPRVTARPRLSRSLVATMATVAVALIALVILLQAGPWGEVLQPEPGPVTPDESAPVADAGPAPAEPSGAEAVGPVETAPLAAVDERPEEGPAAAATEPSPDAIAISEVPSTAVAEREVRTVQFTAPGGTRIIWTLDPDFEFPLAEPDTGARGEL